MTYSTEIQIAVQIVRQAALLARRIQADLAPARQANSPALSKPDRSPVTVADFAIQALVARRLMLAFPNDSLMAEEDSSALRGSPLLPQVAGYLSSFLPGADPEAVCAWIDRGAAAPSERYWMLDPIDGTKGFLRGGQYAVALALIVAGKPQVGVLGCPELGLDLLGGAAQPGMPPGCLVYAVRGQGSWAVALEPRLNQPLDQVLPLPPPVRLRVSDRADPSQARLLRSFEAGHTNVGQIDQFVSVLGVHADPVLMDSQAKYAVLASGQGDLILRLLSASQPDYREKAWDQAAGALVVEEAGGRASDLEGEPFDFTTGRELSRNRGVLVSNGRLHLAALQALKAVGA